MSTINEQLNIPLVKDGETIYQKDLFNRPLEMDSAYDSAIVRGTVYGNANGYSWNNCGGGCGSFNNAEGSALYASTHNMEVCVNKCKALHPFNKTKKDACLQDCKDKYNVHTIADLFTTGTTSQDVTKIKDNLPTSIGGNKAIGGNKVTPTNSDNKTNQSSTTGMSNGAKIGIGVSVLGVIGLGVWYFKFRK